MFSIRSCIFGVLIIGCLVTAVLGKRKKPKQPTCSQRVAKIKSTLKSIPTVEEECNVDIKLPIEHEDINSAVWSVYTRWGRTQCPLNASATLIYTGVAAGSHYTHSGSGGNYLCLPNEPEWGNFVDSTSGYGAYIYGAEYEIPSDGNPYLGTNAPKQGDKQSLHDNDVPCALCQVPRNVVMFPAKHTCPNGWTMEYKGYLTAEHYGHASSKDFECMDEAPETIPGGKESINGALFYPTQAICGVLPCPNYVGGRELTCVVCSK
ncbi:unnamed protein product [Owenia fusiformis]|uniref:Uncharacterized protein n=1 Tax=Owenia fusiformis TaxID=6347 RepID=A0A8J1Y5J4_OWEFU|nr:unnamed protein product [Owenia fusiformis]